MVETGRSAVDEWAWNGSNDNRDDIPGKTFLLAHELSEVGYNRHCHCSSEDEFLYAKRLFGNSTQLVLWRCEAAPPRFEFQRFPIARLNGNADWLAVIESMRKAEEETHHFGMSFHLALALHRIHGLPLVAVIAGASGEGRMLHAAALLEDGRYLDIRGIHDSAEALRRDVTPTGGASHVKAVGRQDVLAAIGQFLGLGEAGADLPWEDPAQNPLVGRMDAVVHGILTNLLLNQAQPEYDYA